MARTQLLIATLPARFELPAAPSPRTDIVQTADALHVTIELPGVARDALQLHFEPGQLVIEGFRERPAPDEAARCLQMEIAYGPFRRALPLPPEADGADIEALHENGMLQVHIPLRPARAHRISIS